jgi:Holliday junction resolvase
MSRSERDKGLRGEREVAAIYEARGFAVRGLEGTGDHLVVGVAPLGLTIHSEVKRQETARVWAWWEQASSEAPAGSMVVVAFRRSRSKWLAIVELEELADLIANVATGIEELEGRSSDG